ncbi:MAG: hypothetical protein AAF611_19805 [Bacteroidota bacterium]
MGIAHSMSHAFSHEEESDHKCEDCFFILDSNEKHQFNFNAATFEAEVSSELSYHKPITLLYKNPIVTVCANKQFFNRPPPSVVAIV